MTFSFSPKTRKRKLLVADDSITIQKLVNLTMAESDFEVITSLDGFDARNKIKRLKPEVVLVDSQLREISGYQLCKEIRKSLDAKDTKIILMKSPGEKEMDSPSEADKHLVKPFDSRALWLAVQDLVGGLESPLKKSLDQSEEDTVKKAVPAGPFSSFREAESKAFGDPEFRLASVAAEVLPEAFTLPSKPAAPTPAQPEPPPPVAAPAKAAKVPEPARHLPDRPAYDITDEQPLPKDVLKSPPVDFDTGEVTSRIDYESLAREEIKAWAARNLPEMAERFLKDEIARILQSKK